MPAKLVKNPTAVQDLVDAHETPSSSLLVAPAGFGVCWIAQRTPFQRSASITRPLDPIAVHAVIDAHDTSTSTPPMRLGVPCTDQLVPFHRSANVATMPAWLVKNPTAVQDLVDAHDTPSSPLLLAPAGLGVR